MSVASVDVKVGYSLAEKNLLYGSPPPSSPSCFYNGIQQPQSNMKNNRSAADYFSKSITIDDNQENRNKLIQGATNRLRQKRLEEQYLQLKSHIIELQSKLDIIKLEASISLNSFINHNNDATTTAEITQIHLDHFEKRLENHRLQLQQAIITSSSFFAAAGLLPLSPKQEVVEEEAKKNDSRPPSSLIQPSLSFSSFTKSSFSSTISSILSPVGTRRSSFGEEQEDYYASLNGGGSSFKRRKRHQQQQQQKEQQASFIHPLDTANQALKKKQQQQMGCDDDTSSSSNCSEYIPSATSYNFENHHRSSDIGATRKELLVLHSIKNDEKQEEDKESNVSGSSSCLGCSLCSCSCSSNSNSLYNSSINKTTSGTARYKQAKTTISITSNRNALDDTISFLNDLASDTDDGGFRQELLSLVDNIIRHNNNNHSSHVSSFASSAVAAAATNSTASTNQVYQQLLHWQQQQQQTEEQAYFCERRHSASSHNRNKKKRCFIKRWIDNLLSTSGKYVRFAIVMTLAIMINIRKGPKSF